MEEYGFSSQNDMKYLSGNLFSTTKHQLLAFEAVSDSFLCTLHEIPLLPAGPCFYLLSDADQWQMDARLLKLGLKLLKLSLIHL
ncbi:unnamed protein product [Ilex paraguariensis]|uniref:Uncharacterized protein n=1 Tax=Ilex paraguariensis TaxID=185542 RepID=A0ABC8TNZ7_9AQUA